MLQLLTLFFYYLHNIFTSHLHTKTRILNPDGLKMRVCYLKDSESSLDVQ